MEEGRRREGYVAGQFFCFCGTFVARRIIHMTDCFNVNELYTALGDGGIGFYQSKELFPRYNRPSVSNTLSTSLSERKYLPSKMPPAPVRLSSRLPSWRSSTQIRSLIPLFFVSDQLLHPY